MHKNSIRHCLLPISPFSLFNSTLYQQASTTTGQSHAVSTWPPHSQDGVSPPAADRPHTISTTYEKGHQRPALTVYTFQNPETIMETTSTAASTPQKSPGSNLCRPPLPVVSIL